VAAVALVELISSGEFLLVALVELELEHVFQEEDGGRGPGRGARRGRGARWTQRLWRARRSSTSSFLGPVDGGRRGGRRGRRPEDQILEIEIKG
jgi:hypothetical protein